MQTDLRSRVQTLEPPPVEIDSSNTDLAFRRRFFSPTTLMTFGVVIALVYVILSRAGLDATQTWHSLRNANFGIYLIGFATYYLSFPLRGFRWRQLLLNAGVGSGRPYAPIRPGGPPVESGDRLPSVIGCAEILYLSWFVNCLVPAKLGDAYRSYLLKKFSRVSFSVTIGTVLAERILDLVVLCSLLAISVLTVVSQFDSTEATSTRLVVGLGAGLLSVIGVGLFVMRRYSDWIARVLPSRFAEKYWSLRRGTMQSFKKRPLLGGLTIVIWLAEAMALFFVSRALGVEVSIPMVVFVALAGSLLTSVPGLPGGLILVEGGMTGALALAMPIEQALAVALLYRTISYWSIVGIGLPLYLVSRKK